MAFSNVFPWKKNVVVWFKVPVSPIGSEKTGSGYGLASNRRQAIAWSTVDPALWCHSVSLGHNHLQLQKRLEPTITTTTEMYLLTKWCELKMINDASTWNITTQIARFMRPIWSPAGAPAGPRWAPCRYHEPCYQGTIQHGQKSIVTSQPGWKGQK